MLKVFFSLKKLPQNFENFCFGQYYRITVLYPAEGWGKPEFLHELENRSSSTEREDGRTYD
jgi:hypothetical protein